MKTRLRKVLFNFISTITRCFLFFSRACVQACTNRDIIHTPFKNLTSFAPSTKAKVISGNLVSKNSNSQTSVYTLIEGKFIDLLNHYCLLIPMMNVLMFTTRIILTPTLLTPNRIFSLLRLSYFVQTETLNRSLVYSNAFYN